ncbi:MAG: (d)CMP kinase [Coriobacteriales bacterium]|nr:(d)CMP kinase [Coriobacteriales bacterium]
MRIAIDGPAGSGKSTVAHALAKKCGLTFLDTGAMYRCVALACLTEGVNVADVDEVAEVAKRINIAFGTDDAGEQTVMLDGADVTEDIRTPEVDANVSAVAAIPEVREAMVELQRQIGSCGDVVAEGRDIGTVVFPDAEVKVFLTADPEARAHRRALQRNITDAEDEKKILEDLNRRDEADSSRKTAPLKAADDAYRMDSSSMTIEEEIEVIMGLMDKARSVETAVAEEPAPEAEPEPMVEAEPVKEEADPEVEAEPVVEAEPEPEVEAEPAKEQKRSFMSRFKRNKDKDEKKSSITPERKEKDKDGPMHVFGNNTHEDYYEHSVHEFPITARGLLAVSIYVCGIGTKLVWPWKVEHGERLWKAEGGQMVVMNHVSMVDPVILAISDWMHGRRLRPLYKSELDQHEIINWFFARIGAIPIQRGKADIKAVRRAQRALQKGDDVLVFPEGTRIHSDDQEVEMHAGFALIAQLAKAPVLPVAIVGARDGTPGGNKPLRPGRIWIEVGEPISFDQIEVKGRKKQAKAMESLAMERVYGLRDKLRARHPGKM